MRTLRIFLVAAFFLTSFIAPANMVAQTTKVRGKVLDMSTGDGIPFATVFFKGTSISATADVEGWFAIETKIDTLTSLSASRVGYSSVEAKIGNRKVGCTTCEEDTHQCQGGQRT